MLPTQAEAGAAPERDGVLPVPIDYAAPATPPDTRQIGYRIQLGVSCATHAAGLCAWMLTVCAPIAFERGPVIALPLCGIAGVAQSPVTLFAARVARSWRDRLVWIAASSTLLNLGLFLYLVIRATAA